MHLLSLPPDKGKEPPILLRKVGNLAKISLTWKIKAWRGQMKKERLLYLIKEILSADDKVVFAYAYGSFVSEDVFRDIDIGIYVKNPEENPFVVTADRGGGTPLNNSVNMNRDCLLKKRLCRDWLACGERGTSYIPPVKRKN